MQKILIGIDPSGEKPKLLKSGDWASGNIGVCMAHFRGLSFARLNMFTLTRLIDFMLVNYGWNETKVTAVIEQPDGQPPFPRPTVDNLRKFSKQCRDLGKNQCISNHIEMYCRHMGFEVILKTPKEKGPKWPEAFFRKVSGYKGPKLSQHEIDAYQLIAPYIDQYGRLHL